jgi:hypothetical protein
MASIGIGYAVGACGGLTEGVLAGCAVPAALAAIASFRRRPNPPAEADHLDTDR